MQQRIEYTNIDKYIDSSIVQRVLSSDTTFEREVEDFYEATLEFTPSILGENYSFIEGQKQKDCEFPTDLVQILDYFSEEPLDILKLEHSDVIADHKRWNPPQSGRWKKLFGIWPNPSGTNNEYREFLRLCDVAKEADVFMKQVILLRKN